jgi:hypothetical protein
VNLPTFCRLSPFRRLRDPLRGSMGKITGVIIGSLAGWFPAIVGLLVGQLLDQLLEHRRFSAQLRRFLSDPSSPFPGEGFPGETAMAASMLWAASFDGGLNEDQVEAFSLELARFASPSGSSSRREIVDLMDAIYEQRENFDGESLARRVPGPEAERLSLCLIIAKVLSMETSRLSQRGSQAVARLGEAFCLHAESVDKILQDLGQERRQEGYRSESVTELYEAWRLLGMEPGSEESEVKSVFRTLAGQFHPDTVLLLPEGQREQAAEAFVRIERAYRTVLASFTRN